MIVMINYEDFEKVEMRVGRVLEVNDFPKARKPAYQLVVDFGDFGIKKTSAQITEQYTKEELNGRLVIAVTNFPPKQIADFMSEVLVLGISNEKGHVVLLQPGSDVPLGGRVY